MSLRNDHDHTAVSVLYARLINRTDGSVVPALVLHTAFNAWPFVIPVLPSDADQRPYGMVVGMFVLIAIWLLARPDNAAASSGRLP